MPTKQGRRGTTFGVVASIEVTPTEVTLVLHDVEPDGGESSWRTVRLYTEHTFPASRFMDLPPEQLQEIGFNIVNRLCALAGLEPKIEGPPPTRRRRK